MQKANDWGYRCMHEKRMWTHNWFVTLTYNMEHMPPGGSVCLRDVQLFMKRLRKLKAKQANGDVYVDPVTGKVSRPVRFFLGAEYGDENRRPHYHALLFNTRIDDLRFHTRNKRGEALYTSMELSSLWSVGDLPMGFITVGELTFESAVYCAKYAMKKMNLPPDASPEVTRQWEERYVVYDADGLVTERATEFAVMSRRPGIGAPYYEKYGTEVAAHDNFVISGRKVRPPRFYDTRTELRFPVQSAINKKARKRAGVLAKADNTPDRLLVKEKLMVHAFEKKERKL